MNNTTWIRLHTRTDVSLQLKLPPPGLKTIVVLSGCCPEPASILEHNGPRVCSEDSSTVWWHHSRECVILLAGPFGSRSVQSRYQRSPRSRICLQDLPQNLSSTKWWNLYCVIYMWTSFLSEASGAGLCAHAGSSSLSSGRDDLQDESTKMVTAEMLLVCM